MKTRLTFVCILLLAGHSLGAVTTSKPRLKVAADGFPAGHDTPEGVASDLARSFIERDVALFTNTCIRPFGGGQNRTNYQEFLKETIGGMKEEAAKKAPSPGGPKAIDKVFAARHLSKDGPASWGYAAFGFEDVMFVDVAAILQNGQRSVNRTLVIKDKDGKWYVHPAPETDSLLSAGLNEEAASTQDFSDTYEIQK